MRLLLFSGGVESTCIAAMYRPDLLLTIDYGQVAAEGELRASKYIADNLCLPHEIMTIPMRSLGAGDMAALPPLAEAKVTESWPFRNQILITLAAMRYERNDLREILIGTVRSDNVHADGTPEFIASMQSALQTQNPNLAVIAPAIYMSTQELVQKSKVTRSLLGWTFSCHCAAVACGQCRGCNKTVDLLRSIDRPVTETITDANP